VSLQEIELGITRMGLHADTLVQDHHGIVPWASKDFYTGNPERVSDYLCSDSPMLG